MNTPPLQNHFYLRLAAGCTFAGAVFLSDARANLVVNGGFEDGVVQTFPFNGTAVGGANTVQYDGTLAGWEVGTGGSFGPNALATNQSLYFATISNGDPAGGGPRTGDVAAVLPNLSPYDGYISQDVIGVVAGQVYNISFWLSNQVGDSVDNYLDVNWGGTFTNSGSPITGGVSLMAGAIPVSVGWTQYSFTNVMAPTNDARLSFIGGSFSAGLLLDDIVVVPEVSSFGFAMGIGLLALGSTIRLRRRVLLTA